ncbi:hypothetical protein JXA80_04000 [bacterium]|nr:hypothetical protein [candidate division CSSED10-310 bacterium]
MNWRRYLWTATILALWVISLLIVDSTAQQTRMGYRRQRIMKEQMALSEHNLRLRCEASVLHDLESADKQARHQNLHDPYLNQMVRIDQDVTIE